MLKFLKKIFLYFLENRKNKINLQSVSEQLEETQKMITHLFVVLKAIRNDKETETAFRNVGFELKNATTASVTVTTEIKGQTEFNTNVKTDFD